MTFMTGHYDNRFNTPILIMHSSLGYVCISLRVYVYITIYIKVGVYVVCVERACMGVQINLSILSTFNTVL